nr:hypothetical protein [uncultured Acinetobacter sp.]
MKDWLGYHIADRTKLLYKEIGESALYHSSNNNPQDGDRVWIIEAVGIKNKCYRLVDCFYVSNVEFTTNPLIKGKNQKVTGRDSLMKDKLPVNFDSVPDKERIKSLYDYVHTSPSFSGAGTRLDALEYLLSLT